MNAPLKPAIDVRALLRLDEGLVHADVYASQSVFELEMEKIFHRGWVYVGHESEIPKNGDFVTRWIGTHSVILNRDDAGKLHLFLNRCRHRAVTVCQEESGNTRRFNCDYHGWTYKTSGELIGMPLEEGAYGADFRKADYPLLAVPRMASYRGFVWGSLSPVGIGLMDHLGEAGKRSIDLFCDASPEGEIVLQQGVLRGEIFANWKFQGGDGYHPPIAHQANFMYYRGRRHGNPNNPIAANGTMEEGFLSRDLGNGHCALDFRSIARDKLGDAPWAKKYREQMHKAYGKERAEEYVMQLATDHLVHAWDLAAAVGAERCLDETAVAEVGAWFQNREVLYRDAGLVAGHITQGDAPQSRLLGGFGRDAAWGPNHVCLAALSSAFGRGDVDAIMALMTGDCRFEATCPAPDGTPHEGADAVRRQWELLFGETTEPLFEEEELFVAGDRGVLRWRFSWRNDDGTPGHVRGADVLLFRDGLVAEKLSYVKG